MRTVCPGWSRPHATPITLADDGRPDGLVSVGMCATCQREYGVTLSELQIEAHVTAKVKP